MNATDTILEALRQRAEYWGRIADSGTDKHMSADNRREATLDAIAIVRNAVVRCENEVAAQPGCTFAGDDSPLLLRALGIRRDERSLDVICHDRTRAAIERSLPAKTS